LDNKTAFTVLMKYGKINAFAALCQCNWETRSGGKPWASELFLQANNAAGIKAGNSWAGEVYEKVSWEQKADGTKYDKKSAFRKYASFEDFAKDYSVKIESCYPSCANDNFLGYFAGLYKGKFGSWATDQSYFERLCRVAIELAPEIFGNSFWRNKIIDSFEYALDKKYLTKEQGELVCNLLSEKIGKSTVGKPAEVPKKQVSGIQICIDAGHGGKDPGACANGLKEKDITLLMCRALGKEFVKRGYDVHYTRAIDEYIALTERARIANSVGAKIFISIHCNSAANASASGFEIWTTKGHSIADLLATDIFKAYSSLVGGKTRQDNSDGDPDKENNWTVISASTMPAVLIEAQFISNADDASRLASEIWREKFAGAVANGVDTFLARG